ncbi:hypothetical protein ZTR_06927 [Talaromyces verruculosus]|nr:hypothetical protein ZTR_06927 [Talaromyces verruculosus]
MQFMQLPVDVILSITHFLSYVELACLVRTGKGLAQLLIPYLYNPILQSSRTPKNPYYGLPWPSWIQCINEWRSPFLLDYFKETPVSNLAYTGVFETALIHLAAQQNNIELIDILLNRGLFLEHRDVFGQTPLHYALDNNKEQMANHLLDVGANVMALKGYALLLAAESCSPAVVERIVEKMDVLEARFKPFEFTGAPTDGTAQLMKNLAINAAEIRLSREIVSLLIRYGADPDHAAESPASIEGFRKYQLGMMRGASNAHV